MRLEFNPRAMCYNLYCDTWKEEEKLKQMLEKPLTATNLQSIDNMIYVDTDSVKAMKTKLNSEYGRMVMTNKDYIVVHQDNKTGVIFKDRIDGVFQKEEGTMVLVDGYSLWIEDKYADIVAMLI